jgi:RHS repeat-associated protein
MNGVGRLSQIDDYAAGQLVGRQTYAYDPQGRLVQQTQTLGSLGHTLAYAYTEGRLTGLTLPSGRVLAYSHDAAGRTSGITLTENNHALPLVQAAAHTAHGRLQGWTDAAGQAQTRSFDLDGQVTGYSAGGQSWTLGYDSAGRLVRIADSANALLAVDYTYDALDRLTRAVLPYTSYSYSYDANGNRNSRTVGASVQAMAIAATSNRLLTLDSAPPVTYSYDATGNRTADRLATYGYDAAGRVVEATSAVGTTRYELNALNLRTRKSGPLGETIFVHDRDGRLLAEADAAGTIQREYVWLDDTLLAILDGPPGSTQAYAVHPDPLGTPRAVTSATGTPVWRNSPIVEPFGLLPPEQDPDGDGTPFTFNLRFPGQYFDKETNLAYNWHRSYDAQVGGYVQSDPIGLAGGQWSTYSYVNGQPTTAVDPEGLMGFGGGGSANHSGTGVAANTSGQVGAGGGFHYGPLGASAESGVAIGSNGSICFYTQVCGTIGFGLAGSLGGSLGVQTGELCSSEQEADGVFASGGAGIYGGGQATTGSDGSEGVGKGFGGVGAGAAAGRIFCKTRYSCMNEPPSCKKKCQ